MGHFSKEYQAEFKAQGRAEGLAEGRMEGEAKVLVRLLEKRFGEVSAKLRERIFASDIATIEAWFDRALEACDLQSIFQSAERG
jgi:predicted transposase YdaD